MVRSRASLAAKGTDVLSEEVEITFGTFSRTLPAGSFERHNAHRFRFRDRTLTVDLFTDGRLEIRGKGLDLSGIGPTLPVTVGLRVGNDSGSTAITLDAQGKFKL